MEVGHENPWLTQSVVLLYFPHRRRYPRWYHRRGPVCCSGLKGYPAAALTQHYEILNIQNIHLNLYLMELQFGIHLAPNMLSIIGVILAAILFRHLQ